MDKPIIVGAVLYNPKVSVIWDIIGEFFQDNGCPIDTVFYTNYELQVEALLEERHVQVNTQTRHRARSRHREPAPPSKDNLGVKSRQASQFRRAPRYGRQGSFL